MSDASSKGPALAGDFRVGEWLVQPSLDRLSRGGTLIHLRPQLTDLLLLLARHAGRTVSKELILKEVWAAEYVGESVLTRCITELRQALQDEARAPKVIETIPKRGYRLVAPVVFLAEADPGPGCEVHPAMDAPAPAAGPAGAASVNPPVPVADEAGGRAGFRLSRAGQIVGQARWTALKVALVIGVAVTVGAGDWREPPAALERNAALLGDVTNTTGNRVFDEPLRLALAANLEQAPFLRLVPQAGIRAALLRMGRAPDERVAGALALDICRREGAAVLLAPSIAPLGSRYAVGVEALACGTGESIGRALAEARDREHVLDALEQVATRIRLKLGESRASLSQHSIPLVRATTASFEALEALTLGDESRDHARVSDALGFYRRATELDPGFAVAWARRGAAAQTLDLVEESVSAFRRAYDLRDKVSEPERFYIEGHYYTSVAPNPQKSIETYEAWKRLYPGSLVPPTNLASLLAGYMGRYDAAFVQAREAVRLGPYSSIAYSNLILSCLGSGRMAEARQAVADAARIGICDRLVHRSLLTLALFDGDRAALEREVQWASADPATALRVLQTRASWAMAGGRLREARALFAEAVSRATEIGPPESVAGPRLLWAETEALVGDLRRARSAAESALAEDHRATMLVEAAIVFAIAGDPARARSLVDRATAQGALDVATTLVTAPVARSLAETKQGQGVTAMAILQRVLPFESGSEFGLAPLAAHGLAELSAGRPVEAVASFERLIGLRAVHPASAWIPFARLAMARALRDAGETARSLAAYDDFLQSWKDADRDAPLLKIAQRERAALSNDR